MADIPSYSDWKSKTDLGLLYKRSDLLKKVDTALSDYWKTPNDIKKKQDLRTAFNAWINSKGGVTGTSRDQTMVQQMKDALQPYRTAAASWTAPPLPATPVPGETYLGQSF